MLPKNENPKIALFTIRIANFRKAQIPLYLAHKVRFCFRHQAAIMKTAETIRSARERAKLTQEQAAALTGYSRSAIQKFELGKRTPPARSLPMILSKLENACQP